MSTFAPFSKPMYVMLKPVGSKCNLDCDYCYYLEKENLYEKKNPVMSEELLERFIKQYIESQTMPEIMFTWHGGETLMRPLSFYKRAIELQKQYGRGRHIENSIQSLSRESIFEGNARQQVVCSPHPASREKFGGCPPAPTLITGGRRAADPLSS